MRQHSKNIQKILSSYFLLTMLTMLILATVIFSIVQYLNLRSNAERDLQRTCGAVAEDIDLQIKQMDAVALNTIHSTLIKETLVDYIDNKVQDSYEQTKRKTTLANALTATKGVDSSIRQVNIYGYAKEGFGTGNFTGELHLDAPSQDWFVSTAELRGHRYIPNATQNAFFSKSTGTDLDRYYLSLYRMYYDDYQNPGGFVEVMKYYDILFERAMNLDSDYPVEILIYDQDGTILFPISENKETMFSYFDYKTSKGQVLYNSEIESSEYVYFSDMEYSDFTAVAIIRSAEFFAPVYRSLCWTLLIFAIVFLMCLLFAKAFSKKLSAPLKTMYHFLSHINPQNQFQKIEMADSGIIEIDKLRNSLNEALCAQKSATDSMLLLKEQELQSQMLAFHSQMNPHFLYNSLTNIAAMAEDGQTEPIAQMCQDITSILRYISSNKEQTSPLEEELEHCDLYLKCMKLRFGNALQYEFDIADDMLDFPVPKLCIQLLVENAVKFTADTLPPWHIQIVGKVEGEHWYIEVLDNGPGFSKEMDTYLRTQMDMILMNGLLPSLALDGMGILNIFIRLYLMYGIPFVFDFGNLPGGGAMVKIGGNSHGKIKPL